MLTYAHSRRLSLRYRPSGLIPELARFTLRARVAQTRA